MVGKNKAELGLLDNKTVEIQSISSIEIENFRSLKNQTLILGEHITVLSGRNGTMKTSLMGLIAHPFKSEAKDAFGKRLKTTLKEVFKLSPSFDKEAYNYNLTLKIQNEEKLTEPVSIYYVEDKTNRHRVVVSGSEKGDGNFIYNTSFLNLKRLYPLVDTQAKPENNTSVTLSDSEISDLKDFYENIFPNSTYDNFIPVHQKDIKTTFALSGASAKYDWQTISSGEDNLGAIFNRLLGFQRAYLKGQEIGNGVLCIDEFESSLHPVAQLQLFEYLYRWSAKYKVQIVLSTHSLHLIQHIYLNHLHNISANRIVINFISKSSAKNDNYPILQNPPYDLAYKELTLKNSEKVAQARKIKVFCEDVYAVHFAKHLIKTKSILNCVEFHTSLDPESSNHGTGWTSLRSVCSQFPLLLEGSLVIFDADVSNNDLDKIRNKNLYLTLPDSDNLAIERRIIIFIINLNNDHDFFRKFEIEREAFLLEFKSVGIKSLAPKDIANSNKTNISACKRWADLDKLKFKKYITYFCNHSDFGTEFRSKFIERINYINASIGIPKI